MADWDEIKRLAADFQKVQLTSTSQRLSERNCIEIISWLVNRKIIDLIFTSDGKEYMTPSQLIQDIQAELYVNGGRINFVELAKTIGVDLSHITSHINDVQRGHKDIHSVLGQLVDNNYIIKIAGEINEKLQQQGQINLSDLTIQYDLPAEFLQQHVLEKHLGKLIHGRQDSNDPRVFFTESFIARSKAKIRGVLIGITKPTSITTILNQIELTDKLFFSLFDQVCTFGFVTSRLAGALYVPNIYSRSQNEWVNNFYKQNGYLEFDALSRLGISDHKTYLKKQLTNEQTFTLQSCIVSKGIVERAEADIDECISSKSYIDIQNMVPTVFNEADIKLFLNTILSNQRQKQVVVIENFILSNAFISDITKDCDELLKEKAKSVVDSGKFQQYQTNLQVASMRLPKVDVDEEVKVDKREERRKKASSGKTGGGTQGRETKTKSTKKHTRAPKNVNDEDDDGDDVIPEKKAVLEVISFDDLKSVVEEKLEKEGLDEIVEPMTNHLLQMLNEKGLEMATALYAATVTDRTANRRQTHNDLHNKLNILIGDIRMFEKGIKLLPSDFQSHLHKYLLKTLCTDITNEILSYIATEEGLNPSVDKCTNEQRLKLVNDLPSHYRNSLQILLKTLAGQNVEDFMDAVERSLQACGMILKKVDKKKDRVLVLNHKYSLLEQLDKSDDPAIVLHLVVLIIFISATQNMLHASGRHIASILSFLKQYLSEEQTYELTSFHDSVTLMLSGSNETDEVADKLKDKVQIIKHIANSYKKVNSEKI